MNKRIHISLNRISDYAHAHNFVDYDQWALLNKFIGIGERYGVSDLCKYLYYALDKGFSISKYRVAYQLMKVLAVSNPMVYALFIKSYLLLWEGTKEKSYLLKAENLADYLLHQHTLQYKNTMTIGSPFRHYVRAFGTKYYDIGTPLSLLTALVGDAFVDLYKVSKNDNLFTPIKNLANYFLLPETYDDLGDELCYYYSLGSRLRIHNANIFVASFLTKAGKVVKNIRYLKYGERAVRYTIRNQNADGSWFYYGPPESNSIRVIDNFHTGFVLSGLMDFYKEKGKNDETCRKSIINGLSFYQHMFTSEGAPRSSPVKYYPLNIHSASQGIITFTQAIELDRRMVAIARKILEWTFSNLRRQDGLFYYEINELRKLNKAILLRWSQSWMFYALSLALKNELFGKFQTLQLNI